LGFPFTAVLAIARYFMKSVPQGAATQTLLAASPLVDGISGEYWVDCQIGKGSAFFNDRAMAQRLWTVSEKIVAAHTHRSRRSSWLSTGVLFQPPSLRALPLR
jgi:WW domain-containing oxidoreductase